MSPDTLRANLYHSSYYHHIAMPPALSSRAPVRGTLLTRLQPARVTSAQRTSCAAARHSRSHSSMDVKPHAGPAACNATTGKQLASMGVLEDLVVQLQESRIQAEKLGEALKSASSTQELGAVNSKLAAMQEQLKMLQGLAADTADVKYHAYLQRLQTGLLLLDSFEYSSGTKRVDGKYSAVNVGEVKGMVKQILVSCLEGYGGPAWSAEFSVANIDVVTDYKRAFKAADILHFVNSHDEAIEVVQKAEQQRAAVFNAGRQDFGEKVAQHVRELTGVPAVATRWEGGLTVFLRPCQIQVLNKDLK